MFVSKCLSLNEKNHLTIGGMDTIDLAEKYGTPLYVMDEDLIRENCRLYTGSVERFYNGNGLILYASKALSAKYMYKLAKEEHMGVDVVSGGELYTALCAGFPAEKIYFHGNNKTDSELKLALENNVGRIIVDNIYELERINSLSAEYNKITDIMFRIKPGIDAHTHDFIMTGQIDSKFGVALETGEAFEIIKTANEMKNVNVVGIHCHIGSQIFDLKPFTEAADVMMKFIAELKSKLCLEIRELNLGGGFGIRYTEEDDPIEYDKYMEAVSEVVKSCAEKYNVSLPFVVLEPGRSVVAPAGITLYTVGAIKNIPGIRKYLSVDGGMGDNPRYILYEAKYDFLIANRAGNAKNETYTVAGKCCESGDILGKDVPLQEAHSNDTLAVLATGAYNYSMASNYNRIPRPAMVFVSGGQSKTVIKRETYEDLIKNDII